MTRRRFSDQQLRYLRNRVPIESLIPIVFRSADGQSARLDCPVCGSHDTAIKNATNLVHCFNCEKNFNPIDLVMAAKHIRFVQAVAFLLDHFDRTLDAPVQHGPSCGSAYTSSGRTGTGDQGGPTALGQLIPSVLDTLRTSQPQNSSCNGCKRLESLLATIESRLSRVEGLVAKS